jgi:hypothetical protein
MARPTFIIGEPEADQALSARKLVLETAKFNVITAHSPDEVVRFCDLFPKADAVILHTSMMRNGKESLGKKVRQMLPDKTIIAITPSLHETEWADHRVNSHDPQELVNLLRELFGDPRNIDPKM